MKKLLLSIFLFSCVASIAQDTTIRKGGGGGAGGSATNAIALLNGKGTNTTFYDLFTSVGPAFFPDVVRMSNNVVIAGELNLGNYPNVSDELDSLQRRQGGTAYLTNISGLILHSNAVKYATERGLTNRQAVEDISGFFWTLQDNGLLSAFHDAAFLRGGQNSETNINVRFSYRGSNGTSYASPVQTDKGILTGSGGGGYNFPTDDLSTNFTLIFSGQTGAGGQTAYSHMISYTHATGSTNFGISIGHDVNNANVVVRSNNTTAVYAANYFGHLFTDYLRDDYPFPFTAGFGYQRSGLLTNWHNGYLGTNSSGNHPLSGLTLITVGSRLDDASPGYAQSWTGTAHAWLLFNRQLSSNEVKNVEVALRWLAPTTHNEIAVGDSTSANIYTKQAESWSYQWFTGPGTNLGEYYIAAASGRSAVSMNSLWDDTVTRRKPQGKVKTATARIWAGINDIYAGGTGQAVWETVSNMTVKATRDGVGVEIATLYPSVAYDASMRVQWTNYNNQILSNANMFKKVYRRDLMFTVTNGVMWYDFLHLSTNGLAEVVKDMALGGQLGWRKVLPTYPVGAGAGKVLTSDANGVMTLETPSGGGSSGGTNFPAVLLLVGNTNLTLQAGKETKFLQITNGNHGVDADLAVPESGHLFTITVSNSHTAAITNTFYTNGVAANFYDPLDKTNSTSWITSAGGMTISEFEYQGSGKWRRVEKSAEATRLIAGTGLIEDTGGVNGLDRTYSTRRYTNYATGAFSINCATDIHANITNVVASSYAITLATPVIGTSGSLGLVSDGSARTLAILSPVAITWLSTNDTATATNILTTASKRSLFAWRVGMGTDGVSTNIHCWVKNQTP